MVQPPTPAPIIAIDFMALDFEGKGAGWIAWMVLGAKLELWSLMFRKMCGRCLKGKPKGGCQRSVR